MTPSSPLPIAKSVVLVGAGNAHLVFLRRWGMRPLPGVAVTLVSAVPVIPYSAMVPAHIAGDYSWDEITIDLVRLCQSVQVRLVAATAASIDPVDRKVLFVNRPPLSYDVVSLGLGSIPACPTSEPDDDWSLVMRPLGTLIRKIELLDQQLKYSPRPFHFVVVGGGASGCELALSIHKRLAKHCGFRLTLVQGNSRLLPEFPSSVARAFAKVFLQKGIAFRVNARCIGSADGKVILDEGNSIPADAILWATQASPPALLREGGLPVDRGGFLRVEDTLQSIGHPAVFGTGDCVAFESYPGLPRNGVHAVRQGALLFQNVSRFLREQPLRPFRPQRLCLCLLNTADGQAVLRYGPFSWKNRWARKLKDRIDRAWIEKYTRTNSMINVPPHEESSEPLMRCGGCGSKISSDVLSSVLKRLDLPDDPRILLGCRAGEDAAVHRVRPELFGPDADTLVEVQTVDSFRAFVDDPYLFGRIAAMHAVSDLYAMNARPFSALAIATLPFARGPIQEAQLYELLTGAVESLRRLGVVLTGGHTTEGKELALGFAVTGFGEEDRLFQKSRLRPGDVLILTKPLGSGALLAAWMRGECRAAWFERLIESLLLPNAEAAVVLAQAGVRACTDITGFGLAGHLFEMLDGSRASARLSSAAVPCFTGFDMVVAKGIVSTLQRDNARIGCRVEGPAPLPAWLFDPQTAGGLLAGVRPDNAAATLQQLQHVGYPDARIIGEVTPQETGQASRLVLK